MGLLDGKKGVIFGVANERSIAWSIAQALADAGATLGFTYQGPALLKRVGPLAERVNAPLLAECDVTDDASLDQMAKEVESKLGKIDFFVHSVAYANREPTTR